VVKRILTFLVTSLVPVMSSEDWHAFTAVRWIYLKLNLEGKIGISRNIIFWPYNFVPSTSLICCASRVCVAVRSGIFSLPRRRGRRLLGQSLSTGLGDEETYWFTADADILSQRLPLWDWTVKLFLFCTIEESPYVEMVLMFVAL
jgi:hypothetical protein